MQADLHIHTKYSDGEYDEKEIVEKIAESGITEFAICDHDTIVGSKKVYELLQKENKYNLIFHSGVELSCIVPDIKNVKIHILYRDFDFDNPKLNKFLDEIQEKRLKKIDVMLELVKEKYNVEIKKEEVLELMQHTNTIGKPHIYKLLCKHGKFDREQFYIDMRDLKSDNLKLNVYEVLEALKDEKGYFTLAHPVEIMRDFGFSFEDIDHLVAVLSSKGLKGMETKHSIISREDSKALHKIAKKYNLVETCGSDFHGPNVKPNIKLGQFELEEQAKNF